MLFLAALLISIMAHLGMIWRTVEGNLFIGFGDGISQMLTFKQYIFEKYQQGMSHSSLSEWIEIFYALPNAS